MKTTTAVAKTDLQKAAVRQIEAYNTVTDVLHIADDGKRVATIVFETPHGRVYEAFEMANVTANTHRMVNYYKHYHPHEMERQFDTPELWGDYYKEAF